MSDPNLPNLAARARYAELCTAVGGEPASGYHRAVLARLSAWTADDDIHALTGMINERVAVERARADRYGDLLAEVAHHLSTTGAPAGEGRVYAVLPTALAALIREAARDETLGEWPPPRGPSASPVVRGFVQLVTDDGDDADPAPTCP
jgi:hypothetical protein